MKPDQIARLLAQAIREGIYVPGASLIQEDLAHRFNVSRSPIREALRMLSAEGLVIMPPGGQGATVRMLTRAELEEIYDLRLMIEPSFAAPIVEHATPARVGELSALDERMAAASDIDAWMRGNFAFHELLYSTAERPHASQIVTGLLSLSQPYSRQNIGELGGRDQAAAEHGVMIERIKARDAPGLAQVMTEHLQHAKSRLLDRMPTEADSDPLAILRG